MLEQDTKQGNGFWACKIPQCPSRGSLAPRLLAWFLAASLLHAQEGPVDTLDCAARTDGKAQVAAASASYPPAADATREQIRAALCLAAERPATPAAWDGLADSLLAPDRETQRLAALVALRAGAVDTAAALSAYAAQADLNDLRWIAQAAPRPLPRAFLPFVEQLAGRIELDAREIAAELCGRLEAGAAQEAVARLLEAGPAAAPARAVALEVLGRVAAAPSAGLLASFLSDPDPAAAAAADQALARLRSRLLAQADVEGCLRLDREARRCRPEDAALALREAQALGLYLGEVGPALLLLERACDERALPEPGGADLVVAEAHLGRAVILFFAGKASAARAALATALARLGQPPPHALAAATLCARIHLAAAALALHAGEAEARVREHFAAALRSAPSDRDFPLFDQALYGTFGPLTILDRLRRTGRTNSELRFLEALDGFLAGGGAGTTLGIPLADAADAPPPGSNAAAQEDEQVKSWVPWWRVSALCEAGRPAEAARVGERVLRRLDDTQVWENRRLAAQVSLELGRAHARARDGARAEAAFRAALDLFEEVDEAIAEQEVKELTGRFRAGAAPYERRLASALASARIGLADVELLQKGRRDEAVLQAQKACALDPRGDEPLLALACFLAAGEDRARARLVFDTLPRSAGLLLGLARLALALGEAEEAERLFATHVSWNVLTPERAALENAWWDLARGAP
ncbi:MAG: hypothetical protein HY812_16675 [Planctomycetes bacterium]|nr:hypothetical protein [Planctomycetota bacterium]